MCARQTREQLEAAQLEALRRLVAELLERGNAFYAPRLRAAGLDRGIRDLRHFASVLEPTTKQQLT
ncbi:MAG: hypothetical protein MI919_15910, partial [Holophagales bacterium]|nr:hypothetical protein [Holophagales bacterium]